MQNKFSCAFSIFKSIFEKLWIFPQNQSILRNSSWVPQLTAPKQEFILGAVSYGAQEGIHLGRRNLRCPSKSSSWAA